MDVAAANGITPSKIQGHDLVKLFGYKGRCKKILSFMLIPLAMKAHKRLVSGMYYDLANGKKCDIDFVCGVVSNFGKSAGVPTPCTDKVIEIAHRIERGELAIAESNLHFF
jgi:2-dehydropantoate 2-reductase